MDVQILIDEAKLPAQNNETWVVPIVMGGTRRQWLVDGFDLALWFKAVMGRYPAHNQGDRDTWDDVKANWPRLEKRFYEELRKTIDLGVVITVDGVRISTLDWEEVRNVPASELPPLTESQREVATKMKLSEEEYSRNFLASERGRARLLAKTEQLVRYLQEQLKHLVPKAAIERVALSTIEHGFEIDLAVEGSHIPVRVREDVVDDFFEGGSSDAEARIVKILTTALEYRPRVVQ